ncbi:unnamed protein product [Durusdinium trenchii]|uniref:Uncharacterized protein n=2 Tax=Durusdinium trenchii TaxID=1381693 RepID=A0ABP0IQQ9_9DINO
MDPSDVTVKPLSLEDIAAAAVLLERSAAKFRAEPNLAEGRLKSALENKELVNVGVDGAGICGVAFRDPKYGWEVYSTDPLCVPALVKDTIATATLADDQKSTFWRDGYLVFPGMLAKEAPMLKQNMDLMMKAAADTTSDWNAVNDGAAFVLAVNERGEAIPGRFLKVQAAALASPSVLEVLGCTKVVEKVRELYSFLGHDVPPHVDVFGTKFFPMWPGGVSVNWHQDCHYFGTASPRIISCGVYLEDTDQENGCLQVVPGSHTRDFDHLPGSGLHSQGEWATPGPLDKVVDVVVPPGSVVLFNSRLLHGARQNQHTSRTRYSLFGHYVPSDLNFGWRGTDFSHGTYADRHKVY